jgi:hypothetical protein
VSSEPTPSKYSHQANEIIDLVFSTMNSELRTQRVAQYLKRLVEGTCGETVWPYTEFNVCVLDKGHDDNHEDARGRKFDAGGYIRRETT